MKHVIRFLKNQRTQGYFISMVMSILLIAFLAVFNPYFFTKTNLLSLQALVAPRTIMAIGMMLLISMGVFDQSVGSIMGMTGIICAYLLNRGLPVIVCILIALVFGALTGLFNGFLVAKGKILPLIATVGTMYVFRGVGFMIISNEVTGSLAGFPQSFLNIGSGTLFGIYPMTFIMVGLLIFFQYVIKNTYLGKRLYYIGGNPASAKSLGFNVDRAMIVAFMICGALCALAGVLSIARFESASRYLGDGLQMDILIACIIGGGSLAGGKGDMLGAFFGTLFVCLLQNCFNLFEINSLLQSVVTGATLVVVVTVDSYLYLKRMRALGQV